MSILKKSAVAAAAFCVVGICSAGALTLSHGWLSKSYLGKVVADSGTKVVEDKHATNTWDDWVWRGKDDGRAQYCSSNADKCDYTWSGSKSTSFAYSVGTSISYGFGYSYGDLDVSVEKQFSENKTWTDSTTETFSNGTTFGAGKWAEPVIVAVRRWKTGHFNGGHFYQGKILGKNYYDWKWDNFASWTGNEKQWTYHMIFVTNKRSEL